MFSMVLEFALLRLAEKAIPSEDNRRSTEAQQADVAGQPKYWRATTSRLGNFSALSRHQSRTPQSFLNFTCGGARYSASSSSAMRVSSPEVSSSESESMDPAAETLRRLRTGAPSNQASSRPSPVTLYGPRAAWGSSVSLHTASLRHT